MKAYQLKDVEGKYYSLYKLFGVWNHKVTDLKNQAIAYTQKELDFAKKVYFDNGFVVHEVEFYPDYTQTTLPKKITKKLGRPKKQSL